MNDININDKFNFFSEIFKTLKNNQKLDEKKVYIFISTEKWLEQLGRRSIS